jgi:hypothetical protein
MDAGHGTISLHDIYRRRGLRHGCRSGLSDGPRF